MSWKRGWWLLALLAFLVLGAVGVGVGIRNYEKATELQKLQIATKVNTIKMSLSETDATKVAMNNEFLGTLVPSVVHVPLPTEVRGIYWTASTARTGRAEELMEFMMETGLNTVVIDLKMDNGEVVMPSAELIYRLSVTEIYKIGRIAVMRDSAFAEANPSVALHTGSGSLWRDKTGAAWLDPSATVVWDEAIRLGREAYALGFDEVQFDYVRFASDGALSSIVYPLYQSSEKKTDIMARFFQTVGSAMHADGIPVSFDLFGMTFETSEDFGIGQRLVDVYPNADFISPMVYPSHYAKNFQGYANPALYPYEVVTHSLVRGTDIIESNFGLPESDITPHWRPWLQDFDIGATYTSALIEAQIHATRDAGASGWILWNARNVYEPAEYLQDEETVTE